MKATAEFQEQTAGAVSARLHLIEASGQDYLFDVESGGFHALSSECGAVIRASLRSGDALRAELIASGLGLLSRPRGARKPPISVPLKAISLAIAQKCNLGCTYCYAQQGGFGGAPKEMPLAVACASVDRLFDTAQCGDRVTLAFMGGEPLSNRAVLHAATHYAARAAARRGVAIGFTLTTNGTLIADEDVALFQQYSFTVTTSIDGLGAVHDGLRPFAGGRGSFASLERNVLRLMGWPGRRFRVLARVTVTPRNLDIPETLRGLLAMGFDSVMFAPLLSAPIGTQQMKSADLGRLFEQLTQCAQVFRAEAALGRVLPLSNVIGTLQRIHDYRRDEYPCGAGGGYVAASADGELFACHRFVDDPEGLLGGAESGLSRDRQAHWLEERNLQHQAPCRSCWARYLCSGSCHYEVLKEGRPACDYIRGWAEECLRLYTDLARTGGGLLDKVLAHH